MCPSGHSSYESASLARAGHATMGAPDRAHDGSALAFGTLFSSQGARRPGPPDSFRQQRAAGPRPATPTQPWDLVGYVRRPPYRLPLSGRWLPMRDPSLPDCPGAHIWYGSPSGPSNKANRVANPQVSAPELPDLGDLGEAAAANLPHAAAKRIPHRVLQGLDWDSKSLLDLCPRLPVPANPTLFHQPAGPRTRLGQTELDEERRVVHEEDAGCLLGHDRGAADGDLRHLLGNLAVLVNAIEQLLRRVGCLSPVVERDHF